MQEKTKNQWFGLGAQPCLPANQPVKPTRISGSPRPYRLQCLWGCMNARPRHPAPHSRGSGCSPQNTQQSPRNIIPRIGQEHHHQPSPSYEPNDGPPSNSNDFRLLVENDSIRLPLNGPLHVHVTVPFSLLVKDFDPNTTRVPPSVQRAPWWWPTWLFGPRYKAPTHPEIKAFVLARPAFSKELWPKLSALLFGKEEPTKYTVIGCDDIQDWEHAAASNPYWSFATGVTDDNLDHVRAVVVRPGSNSSRPGQFTVEELGAAEDAAWKKVLMDTVPWEADSEFEESAVDVEMTRRNHALSRYMQHRDDQPSDEKEPVEKEPVEKGPVEKE